MNMKNALFICCWMALALLLQFALTHLIAEEDMVTFRFTAEATHQGEFMALRQRASG